MKNNINWSYFPKTDPIPQGLKEAINIFEKNGYILKNYSEDEMFNLSKIIHNDLNKKENFIQKKKQCIKTTSEILDNKINSHFYEMIMPEIIKSLNIKSLIRARLNLYPKTFLN